MDKANVEEEARILNQVQTGALPGIAKAAGGPELSRLAAVVDRMLPLTKQNEFWQRHDLPLPQRLERLETAIFAATDLLAERRHRLSQDAAETPPKKSFHEAVADRLIEQLKAGTAPWQRPWEDGAGYSLPMNPTTGKRYKGINAIHLMGQGREDPRWMTYNQAAAQGAQVRRGEKSTSVQYWKFDEEVTKRDANGKPVLNSEGDPVKVRVELERPRVFFAAVFNGEQIDGLPPLPPKAKHEWDPVERAEQILKASKAEIHHGGNRAYYSPAADVIQVPEKDQFASPDRYYATALHELGHWTGHESRLDRDLKHPFGSEGYAREELRAEIASMILGEELGVGHDPGQHAAYVKSWIKALEDDPLEIFRAAADAEKIQGYVLGLAQKHEQIESLAVVQAEKVTQAAEAQEQEARVPGQAEDLAHLEDVLRRLETEMEQDVAKAKTAVADQSAKQPTSRPKDEPAERRYIDVPYAEKGEAQEAGARWDRAAKSWYVPAGVPMDAFRWPQHAPGAGAEPVKPAETAVEGAAHFDRLKETLVSGVEAVGMDPSILAAALADLKRDLVKEEAKSPALPASRDDQDRVYLAVPYIERGAAKAAGARWDKAAKSWYAPAGADVAKIEKWLPDRRPAEQAPAMPPQAEFADALRSLGAQVSGQHPVMDGQPHRIPMEGDKRGEASGFYVGHVDGHPAGFAMNNRTGEKLTWKSKGYSLTSEDRAALRAEAATKKVQRDTEQARTHERVAATASSLASTLHQADTTPYLVAKGVAASPGVLTDAAGVTYLPAHDATGKVWTVQTIDQEGTKRFLKDGRKEGCFHAVGGLDALDQAPAIVISEGYATAKEAADAVGFATVAAFDAGNLLPVAQGLRDRYPDKPILFAADDDRALEASKGKNPGRDKAQAAAAAVNGYSVTPVFAPGEVAAQPKAFTDFNDLGQKSAFGREGVKRQLAYGLAQATAMHELARVAEQRQVQHVQQEQSQDGQARPEQKRPSHARRATRR